MSTHKELASTQDISVRFARFLETAQSREKPTSRLPGLSAVLSIMPQRLPNEDVRLLLIAGWSVELATGVKRPHGDYEFLDFTLYSPRSEHSGLVDFVRHDGLYGDMALDPDFIRETMVTIPFEGNDVYIIHPAITLVSKLADDSGLGCQDTAFPPRIRDVFDAIAILRSSFPQDESWEKIINRAMEGISEDNRKKVIERLRKIQDILRETDSFESAFLAVGRQWKEEIPEHLDEVKDHEIDFWG